MQGLAKLMLKICFLNVVLSFNFLSGMEEAISVLTGSKPRDESPVLISGEENLLNAQYLAVLGKVSYMYSQVQQDEATLGGIDYVKSIIRGYVLHRALRDWHLGNTKIPSRSEKELVREWVPLIIPCLPIYHDSNCFLEIIEKANELLSLDFARLKFGPREITAFSSIELFVSFMLLKIENAWPEIIVEAINEKTKQDGYTNLFIACQFSSGSRMLQWINNYVKAEEGIKELEKKVDTLTPLMSVAKKGTSELASSLIDAGADVNACNLNGDLPIGFAASENKVDMIELLHDAGAYMAIGNNEGYTPFHIAVCAGHLEAMESLIKRNAEPLDIPNLIANRRPIETAILKHRPDLVDFFLSHDAFISQEQSEIKLALKELTELRAWRMRDLAREKNVENIIKLFVRHAGNQVDSTIHASINRLGLEEILKPE